MEKQRANGGRAKIGSLQSFTTSCPSTMLATNLSARTVGAKAPAASRASRAAVVMRAEPEKKDIVFGGLGARCVCSRVLRPFLTALLQL